MLRGTQAGTRQAGATPIARRYAAVRVAEADWDRLNRLAYRTYVPESEHSRTTGAGGDLIDDE